MCKGERQEVPTASEDLKMITHDRLVVRSFLMRASELLAKYDAMDWDNLANVAYVVGSLAGLLKAYRSALETVAGTTERAKTDV